MKIKAQALLNGAEWVREVQGEHVLRTVLAACSPATRARYMEATSIEWHPVEEFCDFLTQAERVVGGPAGEVSQLIGAAGARKNLAGFLRRAAFYVVRPEYAAKRVAGAWKQYNDAGEMVVLEVTPRHMLLEVRDVPNPHELFCASLTGWHGVLGEHVGFRAVRSVHQRCRALGADRCLWRAEWREALG